MYHRFSAIGRRVSLLEVPPLVNHIICCIYHAVKLDFFAIIIHKFQFAAEVSPNII